MIKKEKSIILNRRSINNSDESVYAKAVNIQYTAIVSCECGHGTLLRKYVEQ